MSDAKQVRNQVRNVARELLPDILEQELTGAIRKEVLAHVDKRLNEIAAHMKHVLDTIDQRSKDSQAYVIRQSAK